MTHLNALMVSLSNERARLESSKTEGEKKLRAVWVSQLEKEVEQERKFLGLSDDPKDISDDDLLNELMN